MSKARRRSWSRAAGWIAGALLFAGARGAAGGATMQDSAGPKSGSGARSSEERTVFVTGANRGLGLEFAKQFVDAGWKVIATAREPEKAKDLDALGANVEVVQLDVTDAKSVAAMAKSIEGRPIDLLVHNAGAGVSIEGGPNLEKLKLEEFEHVLQVNALGPVRVTQALLPNLRAGKEKTIVGITSGLGSIAWNVNGGYYGYRESKAALDMFIRTLAAELKPEGFVCIALMPGWVKTDMGGPNATLTPEESIGAMRKVLEKLKPADNGKLFNYDGTTPPW